MVPLLNPAFRHSSRLFAQLPSAAEVCPKDCAALEVLQHMKWHFTALDKYDPSHRPNHREAGIPHRCMQFHESFRSDKAHITGIQDMSSVSGIAEYADASECAFGRIRPN